MAGEKNTAVARVVGLGYWRAADARVVVEAWRRSGETLSEFAGRYSIHPRRVRRWAGQLEEPSVRCSAILYFIGVLLPEDTPEPVGRLTCGA